MSKRIYATKASQAGEFSEFSDYDGYGWFKDVSDDEFETMRKQGKVFEVDGHYFAADCMEQAQLAVKNRQQAKKAALENGGMSISISGGLYGNPGATLKGIASFICIFGIVVSIILAFTFGNTENLWGDSKFNAGIFFGILIPGVVISYLSGLGLAAFGDLVLSANEINRKLK